MNRRRVQGPILVLGAAAAIYALTDLGRESPPPRPPAPARPPAPRHDLNVPGGTMRAAPKPGETSPPPPPPPPVPDPTVAPSR